MIVPEAAKEGQRPEWMNFKSGMTFKSVLAAFYALIILTPASLYMQLMTGGGGIPASLFIMLLWVEFSKLSGKPLTKQEAYMITLFAVVASVPLGSVYNVWYQSSDIAKTFGIGPYIPNWVVPSIGVNILNLRTFFHPAWILPISVTLISSIFALLTNLGLSLFSREMFIEVEKLPFPMEYVRAQAVLTLTEGKRRSMQYLATAAIVGFSWAFILYALPTLWQAWTGRYVTIIPVPWVDLTSHVETVFPGALFGIATDMSGIIAGLVTPFPVVLGTFIASMAKNFFGNWLTVIYGLAPDTDPLLPGYQGWWLPRMDMQMGMARSQMYFWASIIIGFTFAAGFAPFIGHPRRFFGIFKKIGSRKFTLREQEERSIEYVSFYKFTLPAMVIGIVGGAGLFYALVPDFVYQYTWIMMFIIFSPLLMTIIDGFMMGIVGQVTDPIGPLQNLLYYSVRVQYGRVDVWFAPNPMNRRATWLDEFRICQLTETKASSFIKLRFLIFPISFFVGYMYMELFWRIAPIPSARYPATAAYWPVQAINDSVWIAGAQMGLFRVPWVIYSFIIGTSLFLGLDFLHSPVPYLSIAAGVNVWTPVAFTMLIGGILAKLIHHMAGDAWWHEYRRIIASGLALGEGVAIATAVSASLIINALWSMPY